LPLKALRPVVDVRRRDGAEADEIFSALDAPKTGLAIVGTALNFTGFVVLQIQLLRYGIADLTVAQLLYLVIGAGFVLSLLPGFLVIALERLPGNSPSRDRWPNSWVVGDNR
jgi:hypothetical protein